MVKMVSESFAKKWVDIGLRHKNIECLKSAIRFAIDNGHEIDGWEKAAAFRAGYKGYEFKIETFERYGEMNVGVDGYAERSINHAQNETEVGVSVITKEWAESLVGRVSIREYSDSNTKKITVTGLCVGYGSDGEKLILPIMN